jgi:hypothetical protein
MTDEPRPVVALPTRPSAKQARELERELEASMARHPAAQQALPCPAALELPPIGSGASIQCQKQLGHDGNHAANEPPAAENLPPIRRVWPRNGLPTPPRKDAP